MSTPKKWVVIQFPSSFAKRRAYSYLHKYQVPNKDWSINDSEFEIKVSSNILSRVKRILDRDKIEYEIES